MWKKLLILSLSIAMLFVIIGPTSLVYAGGRSININWEVAGTIVQTIAVFDPATGDFIANHSLINLSAQGKPGSAQITLLGKPTAPGGTTLSCETGYFPIADFEMNDFIATFPDQSLLFASIDASPTGGGILCLAGTTFDTTYFIVKMLITGGKGRFEGASGSFTGEGYGYLGFSTEGTLVGENGTLTGTIEFSD